MSRDSLTSLTTGLPHGWPYCALCGGFHDRSTTAATCPVPLTRPFAVGEWCSMCGEPASRKVGEEGGDPRLHNATNHLCESHFQWVIFGRQPTNAEPQPQATPHHEKRQLGEQEEELCQHPRLTMCKEDGILECNDCGQRFKTPLTEDRVRAIVREEMERDG